MYNISYLVRFEYELNFVDASNQHLTENHCLESNCEAAGHLLCSQ